MKALQLPQLLAAVHHLILQGMDTRCNRILLMCGAKTKVAKVSNELILCRTKIYLPPNFCKTISSYLFLGFYKINNLENLLKVLRKDNGLSFNRQNKFYLIKRIIYFYDVKKID